jgi:hypothetical protein
VDYQQDQRFEEGMQPEIVAFMTWLKTEIIFFNNVPEFQQTSGTAIYPETIQTGYMISLTLLIQESGI